MKHGEDRTNHKFNEDIPHQVRKDHRQQLVDTNKDQPSNNKPPTLPQEFGQYCYSFGKISEDVGHDGFNRAKNRSEVTLLGY